ncbi:Beta-lactamase [Bradyrhizobium erythrophlei]|nr:Beta-lactamase [Bradyrhizobium erythrophlei]
MLPAAAGRSGTFVPKPSLPVRLVLLVAGTMLPLIVFAAGIVFSNYQQDRRDATQRVFETVRSIRLVLDAEMQRIAGGLQVLALTNSLRSGDFDGFRPIAAGFLDQYGKDGVVLVADREGRLLFSSITPGVASLPPRNNRDTVEKVFATKRPYYSNLFTGAIKKRPIVTVELLNGGELGGVRLLGPKTLALMTANHLPGSMDLPGLSRSLFSEATYNGIGFGLGFSVTMNPAQTLIAGSAGEYAWGGAATTSFFIDPAEELITIFMTQVLPSSAYPLRRELRSMVYAAITDSNL